MVDRPAGKEVKTTYAGSLLFPGATTASVSSTAGNRSLASVAGEDLRALTTPGTRPDGAGGTTCCSRLARVLPRVRPAAAVARARACGGEHGSCVQHSAMDLADRLRDPDESRDVAVGGADEQVALPVAGDGAVFRLSGPFTDRDDVDDLTLAGVTALGGARPADRARPASVHDGLALQGAACLHDDRLVRHPHSLILGILRFSQPAIWCGDQSCSSFVATTPAKTRLQASLHSCGRRAQRETAASPLPRGHASPLKNRAMDRARRSIGARPISLTDSPRFHRSHNSRRSTAVYNLRALATTTPPARQRRYCSAG